MRTQKLTLRLNGITGNIDHTTFLIGGDYDSYEKVERATNSRKKPLLDGLKIQIYYDPLKYEILDGVKISIRVYVKKFKFTSTYDHNKGQIIEGYKLVLCENPKLI